MSPILLGHVARIIGSVASVVAINSKNSLFNRLATPSRSCSLLQLKLVPCISESPTPRAPHCSGNQSDDGAKSPIHPLSLPRFSPSPQLRCQSPSAGDWDVLSAGNADEALDVNAYLTDEIFDCSSAAGIAASESGALFSSWWDAAAAAVSSTVANAAAQPIIESNILNFLDDSHA